MRALTTVTFVCVAVQIALAQTPLSFEVASVRLNTAFPPISSGVQIRAEQFEANGYSLRSLIALAYGISRIDGAPDWTRDAIKQQLGLDLRSERGPVEFLIIDSIERPDSN